MTHWALPLIHTPYERMNCWGLVRHVFRERHGVEMPPVAVGDAGNESALMHAAHVSGWRRVTGAPAEDDIVLMRGAAGRHVGLMVRANGQLGVLHSIERSGVVWQSLDALYGFSDLEYWRRRA